MALHKEKVGLIKESLLEMIFVSEYAVTYHKTNKNKWGENATGGILGFPASVILFSIIDCIGSIFSGDVNFKIIVDDKEQHIKGTSQHIYILNSKYFNLNLTREDMDNLYNNVRSTLTHNSLLPEGYTLKIGDKEKEPFKIAINEFNEKIYFINVIPLLNTTKKAVDELIKDFNNWNINFAETKIHASISKRDVHTPLYRILIKPGQYFLRIKKWIR